MPIIRFEDSIAWQKAQDLAVAVYSEFRGIKDFGFRDQICRASVSVSNNIAEGFDRNTKRDFSHFLTMARTSCHEVKSMIYLACRLGMIDKHKESVFITQCEETSRVIHGLIKSL